MKNKVKQSGCQNCGSQNTYATIDEIVCRKCGYRRDHVLIALDIIKKRDKEAKK